MQQFSTACRNKKLTIGLVPTMGALHEGHLALVKAAVKDCDIVVVSIFINPTQFGPNEDYKRYPRTFTDDKRQLDNLKVDVIFFPSVKEMYPEGYATFIEVKGLGDKLCGISRPAHFKGVATIVAKLINAAKCDILYLGAKDYQQQAIIRKMVYDLDMGVKVKTVKTVREKSGLAKSSRNVNLSAEEKAAAPTLYKALMLAKKLIRDGAVDTQYIISQMKGMIARSGKLRLDYVQAVNPKTLEPVETVKKGSPVLFALAAFLGKTRLIDNLLIK